jgi:hypothetical protein
MERELVRCRAGCHAPCRLASAVARVEPAHVRCRDTGRHDACPPDVSREHRYGHRSTGSGGSRLRGGYGPERPGALAPRIGSRSARPGGSARPLAHGSEPMVAVKRRYDCRPRLHAAPAAGRCSTAAHGQCSPMRHHVVAIPVRDGRDWAPHSAARIALVSHLNDANPQKRTLRRTS